MLHAARVLRCGMSTDARGSQIFVNLNDNADLDGQGFAPFAELKGDIDAALAALNKCAEVKDVDQRLAKEQGDAYFSNFKQLTKWKSAVKL